MYVIGMGAAIFAGTSDIAEIMLKAGLGVLGLLIVVFATVTTTFLDAYSAGVSSELFSDKLNGKWIAVAATVLGTLAAVLFPMDNITGFLYLIGSVFAPMIAVQIADFFILKVRHDDRMFSVENLIIWLIGFLLYRYLMGFDFVIGSTLLDIGVTMVLCVAAGLIRKAVAGDQQKTGKAM